jgi:putative hydrolase of the HAD superfamily
VLTNSEGRAKELVDEVGLGQFVSVVVDSGVEGVEKPDPRIFATMSERLGHAPRDIVHIGDSYEADVLGAIGAGMTPVWFVREPTVTLPPGVLLCRSVSELRRVLLP